jgi:hypothetical protein
MYFHWVYSKESKTYNCYDSLTNRLYVSRDVIFDEGRVYIKDGSEDMVITLHMDNSTFDDN